MLPYKRISIATITESTNEAYTRSYSSRVRCNSGLAVYGAISAARSAARSRHRRREGAARRSVDSTASSRRTFARERHPRPAHRDVRFHALDRDRDRRHDQRDCGRLWHSAGRSHRLSGRFDALRGSSVALDARDRPERKDHSRHRGATRTGRWLSGRWTVWESGL